MKYIDCRLDCLSLHQHLCKFQLGCQRLCSLPSTRIAAAWRFRFSVGTWLTFQILSGNHSFPKSKKPYNEAEINYLNSFWKESAGAASRRVTVEAVVHAMRSERPQIRYAVGKMAAFAQYISGWFPDSWVDYML